MERNTPTPARTGHRRRRERGSFPTPSAAPFSATAGSCRLRLAACRPASCNNLPRARAAARPIPLSGPLCNPVRWPAVCVSAHWRLESLLTAQCACGHYCAGWWEYVRRHLPTTKKEKYLHRACDLGPRSLCKFLEPDK